MPRLRVDYGPARYVFLLSAAALLVLGLWLLLAPQQKAEAACWLASPIVTDKTPKTNMPGGGWVYGQVRVEAAPIWMVRHQRIYCVNGDVNTTVSARVTTAYWGVYLYSQKHGNWVRHDSRAQSCSHCWGGGMNTKAVNGLRSGTLVKANGSHAVSKDSWTWNRTTSAVTSLP